MTNHTLTAEHERAINETLCRFMGEEYYVVDDCDKPDETGVNFCDEEYDYVIEPFTRSADSLRLVEEKLSKYQWIEYAEAIEEAAGDIEKSFDDDFFAGGIVCALTIPVSLRAAALAEVVNTK